MGPHFPGPRWDLVTMPVRKPPGPPTIFCGALGHLVDVNCSAVTQLCTQVVCASKRQIGRHPPAHTAVSLFTDNTLALNLQMTMSSA